jgi:hypothetical protein
MRQAAKYFAFVGLVILVFVPVAASPQGTDELWQVTTKVEMPGMPMAMPEQTQTVCLQKGQQREEGMVPKDKNCRMTDVKQSGNRTTFTVVCEGKDGMTGTGDITSSPDSYRGTMRMQGTMDGQPVNMTQSFSGRRTGTCTYEAPEKRIQQQMAASCQQGLDQLATPMFVGDQAVCKNMQGEFCGRVGALAQQMRDPSQYQATVQRRSDWPNLLGACGQDAQAVTRDACNRAIGSRDWTFAANYCEADARALATQHCTGRDYTAVMSSEYAPLCRRFASDLRRPAAGLTPAAPVAQPTPPAQQPSMGDAVKEGVKEGLKEGATETIKRLFRW